MLCPNCGTDNPTEAVYCIACGKPLSPRNPPRTAAVGCCPSCGSAVASGLRFCPACGAPLVESIESGGNLDVNGGQTPLDIQDRPVAQPRKRRRQVVWFVVFVAIVVAMRALWGMLPDLNNGVTAEGVASAAGTLAKVKQDEIADEGYDTAEEAAQSIEAPINSIYSNLKDVYANGKDDESVRAFAQIIYDGFPPAFMDASISEDGVTKQEIVDEISQGFVSSLGIEESDLEHLDKFKLTATIKLMDELGSDEIDAVNEWLDRAGMLNRATAGYKVGETLNVEAVDGSVDLSSVNSDDVSDISLEVIEIGGKWFLWSSAFN